MSKYEFLMVLKFATLLFWLHFNFALCDRYDRDSKYKLTHPEKTISPFDLDYEDSNQVLTVLKRKHHVAADGPKRLIPVTKKGNNRYIGRTKIEENEIRKDKHSKRIQTASSEAYENRKYKIKNDHYIKQSQQNYKTQNKLSIYAQNIGNEKISSKTRQLLITKSSYQKLKKAENVNTSIAPRTTSNVIVPIYEEYEETTLNDFTQQRHKTKKTTIGEARLNHDDFIKMKEIINRFGSKIMEGDSVKTNFSLENNWKTSTDTFKSGKSGHRPNLRQNDNIKNEMNSSEDISSKDRFEEQPDDRQKMTEIESLEKKKRKPQTASFERSISKTKNSQPKSSHHKKRSRAVDTRETVDRFESKIVKSSSKKNSDTNRLDDNFKSENSEDIPDDEKKDTALRHSWDKHERRPKAQVTSNHRLRLKNKENIIKKPPSNPKKSSTRETLDRESKKAKYSYKMKKEKDKLDDISRIDHSEDRADVRQKFTSEWDSWEKKKRKSKSKGASINQLKTKTKRKKSYLSYLSKSPTRLLETDETSNSELEKTKISNENMNHGLEMTTNNEESERTDVTEVTQKLSPEIESGEKFETKSTTVKTKLNEKENHSFEDNTNDDKSKLKPEMKPKYTKIDSWAEEETKSTTKKVHQTVKVHEKDHQAGVTQKGRIEDHKKIESVEGLKFFHPHSIAKQLSYLVKLLETNYSITQEIIGRTAEYNDIVMWKVKQHVRFSFRASNNNKGKDFVNPKSEKKIIFIVHGLTVMGWHKVPCFNTITDFLKLFSYYGENLDVFDIFLIPMANPDGVSMSLHKIWNKNVSPQDVCPGVNVDRNFDVFWNESLQVPSCNQAYAGPYPFSEEESNAVQRVLNTYGQKIAAFFHVHVGEFNHLSVKGDAILYPVGYMETLFDENRYVELRSEIDDVMANTTFKVLSVTVDTLYNWYGKVTGTSVDYASMVLGIPYALELVMQIYESATKIMEDAALSELWQSLLDVIFDHIARAQTRNEDEEIFF